jgi:hypothetical protein
LIFWFNDELFATIQRNLKFPSSNHLAQGRRNVV